MAQALTVSPPNLQALLARWPNHPKVDLVTTDGFLFPNAVLETRGLMKRKGFPESYDRRRLVKFVADVKSGANEVVAPVYSHLAYDILPGEEHVVRKPDIIILEGLNVLQTGIGRAENYTPVFVSDYFDFSIYVDADEDHIRHWYVERFLTLRRTAFRNPALVLGDDPCAALVGDIEQGALEAHARPDPGSWLGPSYPRCRPQLAL